MMHPAVAMLLALAAPAAAAPTLPGNHAELMARGREVFVRQVRPLLVERCLKCHGGDKTRGGLDMTTREALLKGGDNGPVVVPFQSAASRLYRLAAHLDTPHMPPRADRLTHEALARLKEWIDLGAPYDRPLIEGRTGKKPLVVTEEDRNWWSFRPLARAPLPQVRAGEGQLNPVDRFLAQALDAKGLAFNAPADRRALLRRAYFDLIGLPPTPKEARAFLEDNAPGSYERLIDRLLASPHFGERWARHWLDLARFAESHGFEHDYDRPTAWPYRDFVIHAFNDDLPYDTFVRWQLAGDELAPDNPLALTATGFLAAGVHSTQITANQVEKERYDELDDMLRTTGTAFLGLTIGCARCHDHKYDPIPTRDYYRLLSTFTTTVRTEMEVGLTGKGPKTKALCCSEGLPAVRLHTQGGDFLEQTHFLKRGDPNQKEGVAPQGFLQVLMRAPDGEKHWQAPPPKGWRTSCRRRALAAWMTDVDGGAGALLARVIVNRLWQHYFGRGLVGTPSDFGAQGERPSHPELLDWLASELIANGWRLKPVHKLLVTSAAYRQSSAFSPSRAAVDLDNRLLWRFTPRRLEAEVIRDTLLAVAGTLDRRSFGPGTLDPNQKRRSIYFTVKRSQLVSSMVLFDAPDGNQGVERRTTTTIAPQALLLMNNQAVRGCAEAFARRLAGSPTETVRLAYQIALARSPRGRELADAVQFLAEQTASYRAEGKGDAERLAVADLCQVVLELNELIFVE